MYLTTSKRASDFGPSRLPDIEFVCKYMLNTRRFSTDVKKILRVIGVPDLVSRESEIRFCIDAEGKIPEGFNRRIRAEFDRDWEKHG